MARRPYEKRSVGQALQTYLNNLGWTSLKYAEGFQSEDTIENPQITVRFVPSSIKNLQIGRVEGGDRVFIRRVQVDAYMESESRVDAIIDDIMDFIDLIPVQITDLNSNNLGTIICYDTESIYSETLPPLTTLPKLLRWRGIVRAEMEAHYPNG